MSKTTRTPSHHLWSGFLLSLVLLTGCASSGTTPIASILDDPAQYDGQSVRIRGEVTESFGVPIIGGGYRVNDGSGTLTVVSGSDSGMPREGAEVQVDGTFHSVFNLGNETLSVLEEEDRTVP
jgi:hypothetical protein